MDTDQLRGHFDRHAIEFDAFYNSERRSPLGRWLDRHFHADIIARYNAALSHVQQTGSQSVLDVGCGPGHYLAALTKTGIPRMVGIDVSEQMISLARSSPDISQSSSVELIQADYMTWTSAAKFDVILALGFFDYVADPVTVLQKMRGEATHSVFASFPSRHWFRTPFRWVRRRFQGTRVYFYSEAQVRELATLAGFTGVEVWRIPGAGMNILATFDLSN